MTIIQIEKDLTEEEKTKLKNLISLVFEVKGIEVFNEENFEGKRKVYQSYLNDLIDDYEGNKKD